MFTKLRKLALPCLILASISFGSVAMAVGQVKTQTSTTLALTSKGNAVSTVASGSVVTLTATVRSGSALVTTGQVEFCDASAKDCTDAHLLGSAQLTKAGTAVLRFRPGIGSFTYKAVFAGTNTRAESASGEAGLTVTGTPVTYPTATTIAESGSWGKYTLTATVTESGGKPFPSGKARFLDTSNQNAILGTATLVPALSGVNWLSPTAPKVGFRPSTTAVGDFNGDGILDMAVASQGDGAVTILIGNGDGTFTAKPGPLAVTEAGYVATADFNGDGNLDLAVTTYSNGTTLAVFLGKGDGTFTQTTKSPTVVPYAENVAVGDFNGDGILDMSVTTPSEGIISILLGKGDGTFSASQLTLLSPGCFNDSSAGDFNGDGKTDLVLTSDCEYNAGHPVVILLGNGDGSFKAGTPPQTDIFADAVAVADLNEDGRPDLAVALHGGNTTVAVFLNNGDGTFTESDYGPVIPGSGPASIAVADFSGDGIVDLAVPNIFSNTVEIYKGNGDGTFNELPITPAIGNFSVSAVVGDFNGDGSIDLVTTNSFDSTISILLSEPIHTAIATATNIVVAAEGQHLVDASYGADTNYRLSVSGTTELWGVPAVTTTTLSITSRGSSVTTAPAGSVVTLTAAVKTGTSPLRAGQVDFCDASAPLCTDIHLIGTAQIKVDGTAAFTFVPGGGQHSYKALFQQNGAGLTSASSAVTLTVNAKTGVTYPSTTTIAQSGVINNYALTATVTEAGGVTAPTGTVSFLDTSYANAVLGKATLGAATPGLAWVNSQTPATGPAPTVVLTADLNLDGKADLAVVNASNSTLTILLGKGDGTFTAATKAPAVAAQPIAIITGDFNGDGIPDLVVAGQTPTNALTVLLGKGDGSFTPAANPLLKQYPVSMAAGDFDGDGILDFAVSYYNDGNLNSLTIFEGKGDGTFTPVTPMNFPGVVASSLAAGDINGDKILDLVGITDGAISSFLGNGDGTFRNGGTAPFSPYESDLALADVNGDGKLDVVVDNSGQESITVFLGNGDGTFSQTGITTNVPQITAQVLRVADFNGDRVPDLAVSTGNYIMPVLLGNGDGTFTVANSFPATTGIYTYADYIAVGDFNGDGRPDVAGVETSNNAVTIQLTQPTETATATANGVAPKGPAPHLVDAHYSGDANYTASTSATTALDVQAPAPVLSLASGTYTSIQTVKITDSVPGAAIYYTINGYQPGTYSTLYTGPITIEAPNQTIQAIAVAKGYETSVVATAMYTLNLQPPAAPVFSLASGTYPKAQTITISESTPGVAVYYTTNGSYPTPSSARYTKPIIVSASETLVAIAANGYAMSPVASAQYIISSSSSSFLYTVAGSGNTGFAGDRGAATAADLNNPVSSVRDAAGNLYIADAGNNIVRKVAAGNGVITTIAGSGIAGYSGNGGPATKAKLSAPRAVAFDSLGNLYIAEANNNVIRKVTATTGIISTYAGNGTYQYSGDNGPGTKAGLGSPYGIAFDAAGNLYVSQYGFDCVRKIAADTGTITTYAGTGLFGYTGDGGQASAAQLEYPAGLAVDSTGNLYISDSVNNVIRKVDATSGVISTFAGKAYEYTGQILDNGDGGPATNAILNEPEGVALDTAGNLYIADTSNQAIRKVTASTGIITTVAGNGIASGFQYNCEPLGGDGGPATSASLCYPTGISVDSAGNLYIADQSNRVREATSVALSPTLQTAAPTFQVTAGTYTSPQTVTISDTTPGAAIYITVDGSAPSTLSHGYHGPINVSGSVTIQAVAAAPGYLASAPIKAAYTITSPPATTISTLAGSGVYGFVGGPAATARFGVLSGIALSSTGDQYYSDSSNSVIWKLTAKTGDLAVFAGNGTAGYSGDGGLATAAQFNYPSGIMFDTAGNLYIADSDNNVVRKISASSGIISTVAGNGHPGYPTSNGDGGLATAAALSQPSSVAVDSAGNLYIADTGDYQVRKVSASTGIITTIAGNGTDGYSGDGGSATKAAVGEPNALVLDKMGNLYCSSLRFNLIRKVTASTGIITTVAGNGSFNGSSGDGGSALLAEITPQALAIDDAGNLYLSDWPSSIREVVASTGIIQRVAGIGYAGYSGDGGSATVAEISAPTGIAFDSAGDLYLVDSDNFRIRKVTSASAGKPAATPLFSAPGGIYASPQSITITDATPGSTVYYTTDGTMPTTTSGRYSGPITVAATETIQAVAVATGYSNSATASATYTIGTVAGIISLSPGSLSFPSTRIGSTSATQIITVTNSGANLIAVKSYTCTGPNADAYSLFSKTCVTTLAAGASCTLTIAFKPLIAGTLTASLVATDSASGSPQSVPLTGIGTPLPTVRISPTNLTFPSTVIRATSAAQVVTVTNIGKTTLTVKSYLLSGLGASDFQISAKTCVTTLAAGASCTLTILFRPDSAGTLSANLVATDSSSDSPQSIALTGVGTVAGTVSISPPKLTLAPTTIGWMFTE